MGKYINAVIASSIYSGSIGSVMLSGVAVISSFSDFEFIRIISIAVALVFTLISLAGIIVAHLDLTRHKGDILIIKERENQFEIKQSERKWRGTL